MPDFRSEDVRKLHAEVNQLVNQRYLLTTLAVTLFGVVTAWIVPRSGTHPDPAMQYATSTLLLILLALLFGVSHSLRMTLRTITSYMEVFGLSVWEGDWREYRNLGYVAYTRIQTRFFLMLGLLVVAASWATTPGPRFNAIWFWVELVTAVVYFILVVGMGFLDWWHNEDEARNRWTKMRDDRASKGAEREARMA